MQSFVQITRFRQAGLAGLLLLVAAAGAASAQDLDGAEKLLRNGQADAALHVLEPAAKANPNDAQTQNLLCRVYYSEKRWDDAAPACVAAARLAPQNSARQLSNDALWAGRVLGEQAQHANPVTAYRLARQVRQYFESAVQFDGSNGPALRDLGEFYTDAPALLGGGYAKAQDIASRLSRVDPSGSHWLLGHIAEARKDPGTAEREYRAAVTAAPEPAMPWADLASFFVRQNRADDAVAAVHAAVGADKRDSSALVDAAAILLRLRRELPLAAQLLQRYINGGGLSEDAPLFAAHARLAQVYDAAGDTTHAQQERHAAHALASAYDDGTGAQPSPKPEGKP